ncbi:MAG: hypothetical protein ACREJ6_11680 [Candidatus Methylomirabilis sp.]
MATTELVRLLDVGKALVAALDRAGIEVKSALWLYDPEIPEWRLILSMPMVAERGTGATYDAIAEVFRTAPVTGLYLRQIHLARPKDPLVASLSRAIHTGPSIQDPPVHLARSAFDNILIEEAYIYRST